jgi:hypothetical protein
MNDPHVEALHYRINHADSVDFEKASPLEWEHSAFSVRIENGHVAIVMKEHHSTAESARAVAEPFLRAWELQSTLFSAADKFKFTFQNAEVIDRRPTPRVLHAQAIEVKITSTVSAHMRVSRVRYPDPPVGLACDDNVDLMLTRYREWCERRRSLGDAAYFCLTVLRLAARNDKRTLTQQFGIASSVINKLGMLTDEKGGKEARKAKGAKNEYTNAERTWLEEAMRAIIRRAAEVACDRHASRKQITMADLPSLD